MAARTGKRSRDYSADERRADGAKGICPATRATATVIATTMIAPITPDPPWWAVSPPARRPRSANSNRREIRRHRRRGQCQ
jgi:hypothetical protein